MVELLPAPMTPEEITTYHNVLRGMSYPQLAREREVVERNYTDLAQALPSAALELEPSPHPVVQQRLILLNELYLRGTENPALAYSYNRNKAMLEWGLGGAIAGGALGYMFKDKPLLGAAAGLVVGVVAGRSELFQQLLTRVISMSAL